MEQTMRHFRATPRTVEGLEAIAHQVHVKSAIHATAVGHNGDSWVQATVVLLG